MGIFKRGNKMKLLVSKSQCAEMLSCDRSYVRYLIKTNKIKTVKLPSMIHERVVVKSVESFIESLGG